MKMLINGELVDASNGAVLNDVDPYTGEVVDTFPDATEEDVKRAIGCSVSGQKEWNAFPLYKKLDVLARYISLVEEHLEEIAMIMCREGGKPIGQCRGEIISHNRVFNAYMSAANSFFGQTIPLDGEERTVGDVAFTVHEPLGVFACIIPFNFPVKLYAHKMAPALVTGNSVIMKPASDTPLSSIMLTKLLVEAGVPGGAAQCVTGSGSRIGSILAEDPRIAGISFTGGTEAGIKLSETSAKFLRHVGLELGGNDPFIVFADSDIDKAVSETVGGRAGNSGQTCCASKRFIVENSVREEYTKKLCEKLSRQKLGDPKDPSTDMGPIVSEKHAIDIENQVNHTIAQGAKCVLGGKRDGTFYPPTVLSDVTIDMDVATDLEIFGPVFPIIGFDTEEEAVRIANATKYGLSSGLMCNDIRKAIRVASQIQAGACVINGSGNYRMMHQPYGGTKMTGMGREGTACTLREFTKDKTIALKGVLG